MSASKRKIFRPKSSGVPGVPSTSIHRVAFSGDFVVLMCAEERKIFCSEGSYVFVGILCALLVCVGRIGRIRGWRHCCMCKIRALDGGGGTLLSVGQSW